MEGEELSYKTFSPTTLFVRIAVTVITSVSYLGGINEVEAVSRDLMLDLIGNQINCRSA